ncbi:MAG: methyltransferase domain-containing protein [Moorea sp. SIO2B7]|nr:methyltransferase domain-containing protein [Moorena sp. SIO2B7]
MAGSDVKADLWISEYITPWDVYVHGITKILAHKQTAYQQMYIVETGAYGKALVLDGKWQSCTVDEFLYHEPLVHPAMIAHKSPKTALVLGGGEGATIREILRWKSIEKVKMVDIDGEVIEACKEHLPEMHQNSFDDPRVELVIGDALEVLDNENLEWDIIISDLSDPIDEGPSFQLFTKEFFEKIDRILAPGGFLVVQAGPVDVVTLTHHCRLINTLKTVYPNVLSYSFHVSTYGSPWGFALCSKEKISTRPDPDTIDKLLAEKTTGGFRFMDGIGLLGLLQTPSYIRRAIETHTKIFTLKEPPKFFGQGTLPKGSDKSAG